MHVLHFCLIGTRIHSSLPLHFQNTTVSNTHEHTPVELFLHEIILEAIDVLAVSEDALVLVVG